MVLVLLGLGIILQVDLDLRVHLRAYVLQPETCDDS